MNFFSVNAILFFASLILARKQDLQVFIIKDLLTYINKNATLLDTYIKEWDGTVGNAAKVLNQTNYLLQEITDVNKTTSGFASLIETDVLRLAPIVLDLTRSANAIMVDLVKHKVTIFEGNAGTVAEGYLVDGLKLCTDLRQTPLNLVPDDLRTAAQTLSAGITPSVQGGVNTFKCLTCDSKTGEANTCDPKKDAAKCYSSAGTAVRSLSMTASFCLTIFLYFSALT